MEPNQTQWNPITRLGLSSVIERNQTHKKKLNISTQSKVRMTSISTIGFDLKMDGFDDGFH